MENSLYRKNGWRKHQDTGVDGSRRGLWLRLSVLGRSAWIFPADGKYSQISLILRDKHAVISTVAECRNSKILMDAIFEELYPQL